jgi:predicted nucleic acid-binding Zn ribbon protein
MVCVTDENTAPDQYPVYTYECPLCNKQHETVSGTIRVFDEELDKCPDGSVSGVRKQQSVK